jgi:hypothetical protein
MRPSRSSRRSRARTLNQTDTVPGGSRDLTQGGASTGPPRRSPGASDGRPAEAGPGVISARTTGRHRRTNMPTPAAPRGNDPESIALGNATDARAALAARMKRLGIPFRTDHGSGPIAAHVPASGLARPARAASTFSRNSRSTRSNGASQRRLHGLRPSRTSASRNARTTAVPPNASFGDLDS